MLNHTPHWVDGQVRGFYSLAMRTPDHMRFALSFSGSFTRVIPFWFRLRGALNRIFKLLRCSATLKWFLCRRALSIGAP